MSTLASFVCFRNIAVGIILILWLKWLWNRRQFYSFALSFPGTFGLPIVGNFASIGHIDNSLQYLGKSLSGVHKSICFWFGLNPSILTIEPEVIERILSSSEFIEKAMPMYKPFSSISMTELVASPEKIWRPRRKAYNMAFKHTTLLSFFPIFNVAKNHIVSDFDELAGHGEHFVKEKIMENIFLISLATLFDENISQPDNRILSTAPKIIELMNMTSTQMVFTHLNLHDLLRCLPKFQSLLHYLKDNIFGKLIKQKFDEKDSRCNSDAEERKLVLYIDLLYKFYKAQKSSFEDILGEIFTMIGAAFETTSNTLYSAIVFLAMHPSVQEHLFQEIVNAFPDKNIDVQYDDFHKLPYLEMVLQETLRLAPAIPLIAREITKPFELPNGKIVPRGFKIHISMVHLHRRKDIWGPNADSFDPDHFLPENFAKIHPYAYVPFSKGIRNCIGWRYAQLSMKVILVGLVRNFRFETDFKYEDLAMKFNLPLMYTKNPALRIYRRL